MRKSVVTALLASAIALPIALHSAASVSAPADGGTVAIVGATIFDGTVIR